MLKSIDRLNWDWEKQDIVLAREHNLSRERVRQIRQKLEIPPSPFFRQRSKGDKIIDKIVGLKDNHTTKEIASLLKVNYHTVSDSLRKYNLQAKKTETKYPYDIINFRLPVRDLEIIWNAKHIVLYNYKRKNNLKPFFDKRIKNNWSEYIKEIENEIAKAKKYYEENNLSPVT